MTPRDAPVAVLALGANVGQPLEQLQAAVRGLGARLGGMEVSSVYRSAPEGGADQPDYLNAVVQGTWTGTPEGLLAEGQALEEAAGRVRPYPGAPRTLDVDVIFLGDLVVEGAELEIPHPRWRGRPFVVVPLLELDPRRQDPETGVTVEDVAVRHGWTLETLKRVASPEALLSLESR